eukprot:233340-Pelagomonas_calceolata.AAC.1
MPGAGTFQHMEAKIEGISGKEETACAILRIKVQQRRVQRSTFSVQTRKGKGYIAVPAYEGSLAEA